MDTETIVQTYYQSANIGDWDRWLTLFDEHIVMDEQLAGHIQGIVVLQGAISAIKRGYASFQNQPLHIVLNGEEACVVSHISAKTAMGVSIEANVANYFQVRHGKIAYMANFHDTVPFAPFVQQ